MSTRSNIHFTYQGTDDVVANIYRHSDGYPDAVLPDLERFFTEVEGQTPGDTRFDDPSYLAAKFVVWEAGELSKYFGGDALAFLGVGVTMSDAPDGEYIYTIACGRNGRPQVTWKEAE